MQYTPGTSAFSIKNRDDTLPSVRPMMDEDGSRVLIITLRHKRDWRRLPRPETDSDDLRATVPLRFNLDPDRMAFRALLSVVNLNCLEFTSHYQMFIDAKDNCSYWLYGIDFDEKAYFLGRAFYPYGDNNHNVEVVYWKDPLLVPLFFECKDECNRQCNFVTGCSTTGFLDESARCEIAQRWRDQELEDVDLTASAALKATA